MERFEVAVDYTELVWVDAYYNVQRVQGSPQYHAGTQSAGAIYLSGDTIEYVGYDGYVYQLVPAVEGYTPYYMDGQTAIEGEYLVSKSYTGNRLRLCANPCETECQDICETECQEACEICEHACEVGECQTVDETGCEPVCEDACQTACEFSCETGCQGSGEVE